MDSEREKGECPTQPLDVRIAHVQIASGDIHIIINWFDRESTTGFGLEVVPSFACVGVAQQAIARRAPNRSALTTC